MSFANAAKDISSAVLVSKETIILHLRSAADADALIKFYSITVEQQYFSLLEAFKRANGAATLDLLGAITEAKKQGEIRLGFPITISPGSISIFQIRKMAQGYRFHLTAE